MSRYFFHFSSEDEFIPDNEGVVLDGLEAAHWHAMILVRETMPIFADTNARKWTIEIADDRQFVHLTVLVPAVIQTWLSRGVEVTGRLAPRLVRTRRAPPMHQSAPKREVIAYHVYAAGLRSGQSYSEAVERRGLRYYEHQAVCTRVDAGCTAYANVVGEWANMTQDEVLLAAKILPQTRAVSGYGPVSTNLVDLLARRRSLSARQPLRRIPEGDIVFVGREPIREQSCGPTHSAIVP